jgi:hypothetical protein
MMSERIGSHGWRIWKEKDLPQEVVPLSDAEGVVAQLEAELEQRRTQRAHLQPVYLEVCEENEALQTELGRVVIVIRSGLTDKPSLEKLDAHIMDLLISQGYFEDALLTGEADEAD